MHPDLVAAAYRQGGVFTALQARGCGYSADEIRARLVSGRWVRVRRGIYRGSGDVDSYRIATAAALLAAHQSDPVASHRCAAVLLDLPLLQLPACPELTVPPESPTTSIKGCVLHHEKVGLDRRRVIDGLASTDAARTTVDLAMREPFASAVLTADAVLRRRDASRTDLAHAASRFRGLRLFARVERVLAFATDRSASPGESLARVVFAEQGLPAPLLGEAILVDGEVIAEVDFLWREQRTIGEFDGKLKYLRGNDRGDDVLWQEKLREERLREAGFEVVRMTWAQITQEPRRTADRVRAAFARPR